MYVWKMSGSKMSSRISVKTKQLFTFLFYFFALDINFAFQIKEHVNLTVIIKGGMV